MDTILNLIPGRKQLSADEPNEEAIRRTHDYLRSVTEAFSFRLRYASPLTEVLAERQESARSLACTISHLMLSYS